MSTPPNAVPGRVGVDSGGNLVYSVDGGLTWTAVPVEPGSITVSAPLSGAGTVGSPATIAAGALPLTAVAVQAADTFVANGTGGSASPTAITAAAAAALLPAATPSAAGLMSAAQFNNLSPFVTAYTTKIDFTAASATYSFVPPLINPGFLFVGQRAVLYLTAVTGTASVGLTYSVGNDASFLNIIASSADSSTVINTAQAVGAPVALSSAAALNGNAPFADGTAEIKLKVITPVTTSGTCVGRLVMAGTWVPV